MVKRNRSDNVIDVNSSSSESNEESCSSEDSFEDSSEVSSDDERKTSSYNKASYNEIKVNI